MKRAATFAAGVLCLASLSCVGPDRGSAPPATLAANPSPEPTGDAFEDPRRARTRAQFEAAASSTEGSTAASPEGHVSRSHAAFGCPLCSDPMAGRVPDDALIVGPASVWQ